MEGLRTSRQTLYHNTLSLVQDSNPKPPEYEAGVLTTQPQCSVDGITLWVKALDVLFGEQWST
jgi:hypothetical protein